jgi:hypothetical protein
MSYVATMQCCDPSIDGAIGRLLRENSELKKERDRLRKAITDFLDGAWMHARRPAKCGHDVY